MALFDSIKTPDLSYLLEQPAVDITNRLAPIANAVGSVADTVNSLGNGVASYVRSPAVDEKGNLKGGDFRAPVKFPNDLGEQHIPDFIAFYFLDIADEKGFINKDSSGQAYGNEYITQASKKTVMSKTTNPIKKVSGVVGKVAEAGAGGYIALANTVGVDPKFTAEQVGAAAKESTDQFLHLNSNYLRTTDIVNLMMPSSVHFFDGAQWQAVNSTPSMIGLLAEVAMADNSMAELKKTGGHWVGKMISKTLYEQGEAAYTSVAKKVYNPYVSQAFETMNRRSFKFDWVLTPKNQTELDNILKIIKLFRYHMHPSLVEDAMFLQFPSQLEVEFKVDNGAMDNPYLPKISRCVIKEFTSNYTPNNQWATVDTANDPGAPAQYQISVIIEEITPLVKKDIEEGF